MKASENFLKYAAPIYDSASADVSEAELQKILVVPILVWNAVVLDKNLKRRKGDIPKSLKDHLQTGDIKQRKVFKELLRFWVLRKDHVFGMCNWPLDVNVYTNVKGALIIRAQVFTPNEGTANIPSEWLTSKPLAPIVELRPTSPIV